jgi:hypothetical protein
MQSAPNPQKHVNAENPLSHLSLESHRQLNTLLYRFIRNPQNQEHRAALKGHLEQNGATYLENPAMGRKTAGLIADFVQHPTNQGPGKIPPTLQALHQFNGAFQEIRQAVTPLSSQTQPALAAGFQKLETISSSLSTGAFGPHSEQTIKKAILNSVKIGYNITHRGVEAATMRTYLNPRNDAEAKTIAQAQQRLREAREKFPKDLQKAIKTTLTIGKDTADLAINFVPGGQVVGVSKTLQTATGVLVKTGQTILIAQASSKAVTGSLKGPTLDGAEKAPHPNAVNKSDDKSGPIQTAERIAQAGSQIDSGIKRMQHKNPEQLRHTQELQALPRMI